ncbi:MAG: helix-turn-helix domain-containing protein [Acidobacteriota bacterium]
MSWKATAHVKELTHAPGGEPLTRSEKLLLLIIADYYNDEKKCAWASVPTIAENALLSQRRVQQVSRSAEMKGVLRVTHRNGKSNVYRLPTLDGSNGEPQGGEIISPLKSASPPGVKSASPGGEIFDEGVKSTSPHGVKHVSPELILEPQILEPQKEPPPRTGGWSKYDLETCRRFAHWLYQTNQGIHNPEGFARDCWMTGLADNRIDEFLRDEQLKPQEKIPADICRECGRATVCEDELCWLKTMTKGAA